MLPTRPRRSRNAGRCRKSWHGSKTGTHLRANPRLRPRKRVPARCLSPFLNHAEIREAVIRRNRVVMWASSWPQTGLSIAPHTCGVWCTTDFAGCSERSKGRAPRPEGPQENSRGRSEAQPPVAKRPPPQSPEGAQGLRSVRRHGPPGYHALSGLGRFGGVWLPGPVAPAILWYPFGAEPNP